MADHPILVLDDKDDWIAQLKFHLEEEGFHCLYSRTGEDAIAQIKQDYHHRIKVMMTDELLLVDGDDDGERQRYQGSDVRREVHKIRPDIKFIVISDLPYRQAKQISDIDKGMRKAMQLTSELSQGKGVIAVLDKISLGSPETKREKYQWLFDAIRQTQGEVSAPKKAGLYIGIGIPESQYRQLLSALNINNKTEIRLHEYYDKFIEQEGGEYDRRRLIDVFLRKSGIAPNVKDFLASIPEKKQDKEQFIQNLPYRIDYIFKRKMNSNRLTRQSIDIHSSRFRILMILGRKSEIGDDVVVTEQDYPYGKRLPKVQELGNMGISQYSYENAIDAENCDDAYTAQEFSELTNHDAAYTYDAVDNRRKAQSSIKSSSSSNPLKTAISRLNKDLKAEKFGQLNSISVAVKEQSINGWQPSFQTGIILYPIE
jgi:CheY-like chemotaxis protein